MKFLGTAMKEILTFITLAVIIVIPIRLFVAQPFVVEGESMHPTFESGDYLIVDQLSYRFGSPKRGDPVVFRYPNDPSVFYIKRVIGLPGETVHIDKGKTSITKPDGTKLALNESYVVAEDATYTLDSTLGEDEYFVMGDNRPRSSDSRVWGPLPREDLMGRAFIRLLPPATAGVLPGAVTEPQ
ncbi:MAG TPA: signal peptidase I [Candidatus Paceibacterota bacterium]|nr:signal peptidase I [Candidatus Paceibacterota bacterium]